MPEEIYRPGEAEMGVLSLIIDSMFEGRRCHIALPSFLRSLNYESILDPNETNVTPFSSLYSHDKMIHDTHWLSIEKKFLTRSRLGLLGFLHPL